MKRYSWRIVIVHRCYYFTCCLLFIKLLISFSFSLQLILLRWWPSSQPMENLFFKYRQIRITKTKNLLLSSAKQKVNQLLRKCNLRLEINLWGTNLSLLFDCSRLFYMDKKYILLPIFPCFCFCSYRWIKNGKPFSYETYDDRISQQPGRGTLVIKSPRDEDIGKHLVV